MKFTFFIATLVSMAVAAVFALPTSHTAINAFPTSNTILHRRQDGSDAASLINEALCNNTTLTWKVALKERKFYFNAFEFRVKYHDASIIDYVAYMIIGGMSNDIKEKTECYIDDNWIRDGAQLDPT
ncbi:hypothetical protein BGZ95_003890 [Linnemannia exigua]|uniref:Uncharacterized protein n=1 Tax=Linnemannia exigua TaxID=604196 RepID=A0AAD4D3M9_9FUNG|nr:hypothetical protein BGZ95_003890 [Linnemannia exigua]